MSSSGPAALLVGLRHNCELCCVLAEERCSVRQAVLSCSLTEEQAQSGEEEEEDGTETD